MDQELYKAMLHIVPGIVLSEPSETILGLSKSHKISGSHNLTYAYQILAKNVLSKSIC